MSIEIKEGDIVYDAQYQEVFTYQDRDRFIKERLRLATDEEKNKLKESGDDCISLKSATN